MINSSHSNQLYSSILLLKYLLHLQISLVNPVGPYRIGTVKSSTEWLHSVMLLEDTLTCSSSEGNE